MMTERREREGEPLVATVSFLLRKPKCTETQQIDQPLPAAGHIVQRLTAGHALRTSVC